MSSEECFNCRNWWKNNSLYNVMNEICYTNSTYTCIGFVKLKGVEVDGSRTNNP